MERNHSLSRGDQIERQLAHLKVLSRLLGHELHAQTGTRITLSRDEVGEVRTILDLFIEESMRGRNAGAGATPVARADTEVVPARVN
jgi:hypothetical protein